MARESSPPFSPSYRWWIPAAIVILTAAVILGAFLQEHTMRVVLAVALPFFASFLVAFWWVFLTGRFRWRTLLGGLAALILFFTLAALTLRFDGAASGSNVFGFAWKWNPRPSAPPLPEAPAPAPQEPVTLQAGHPGLSGFLGQERDGRVPDSGWLRDWQNHPPRELWRRDIGQGWSSFAIAGEFAVTQEQRGEQEHVTAYHLETGDILWSHSDPIRFSEPMGGDGPRATSTIADDTVYAFGATGLLNALDLKTGKLRWSRSVLAENNLPNAEWGVSSSPLVYRDTVLAAGGHGDAAPLNAYHRITGQPLWSSGSSPASYSSPIMIQIGGVEQIVAVLQEIVAAFDPESGAELWSHPWPGSFPKVAQPAFVAPNRLLLTASYGIPSLLIELTRNGDSWSTSEIWNQRSMKTKFSSPLVIGDYAYGIDEGHFACIALATGKRQWKGGKYGYGQNLLVGDDLILIQAEDGRVVLVQADPAELRELASIKPLSSKTWNAPALSGPYLVVRNDREAVCLLLPTAP